MAQKQKLPLFKHPNGQSRLRAMCGWSVRF